MEAASLAAGVGRVKFATHHLGPTLAAGLATPAAWETAVTPLLRALTALADSGCAPTLPDGATGGNAAMVDGVGGLLVSRSGKAAGVVLTPADVVRVVSFDTATWAAEYETPPVGVVPSSSSPMPSPGGVANVGDGGGGGGGGGGGIPQPTSDTPLLWAALMSPPGAYGWPTEPGCRPTAALHGHALETPTAASAAAIPFSPEETLFSTPADVAAAARVWTAHPYPGEEVWVRRGHGWFAVAGGRGRIGGGAAEGGALGVVDVMRRRVLPYIDREGRKGAQP
ncbi:hypothetical protein MMPV_005189 [Pyropia vietnamensis]